MFVDIQKYHKCTRERVCAGASLFSRHSFESTCVLSLLSTTLIPVALAFSSPNSVKCPKNKIKKNHFSRVTDSRSSFYHVVVGVDGDLYKGTRAGTGRDKLGEEVKGTRHLEFVLPLRR